MNDSKQRAVAAVRPERATRTPVIRLAASLAFAALALILPGTNGVAEARSPLIGKSAPELLLAGGVNGVTAKTKLKQFIGKPVLLTFFNPGCRRCKQMMPIVDSMTRRYTSKGLVSIGVTTKASAEVRRYLIDKHYTFSVGIDSGQGATMSRYGIRLFPTIFIIGIDGTVKPLVGGKFFLTIEHELELMKKAEHKDPSDDAGKDKGEGKDGSSSKPEADGSKDKDEDEDSAPPSSTEEEADEPKKKPDPVGSSSAG